MRNGGQSSEPAPIIPNHVTARLSELDLAVARAVPPGGNWKNVPHDIPLKRLDTIRRSFARGEGSRSTYYGRLRSDRPAYTINTYFSRPGNGCHLHHDYDGGQHRVLSQREAARLQSFPDAFVFHGPKTSIDKQVGNAVPPLMAYQVALQLGPPGQFVDLFCGAGGLGLGLVWAGWEPIVANDIDARFLETYSANVDPCVVTGDIRERNVLQEVVAAATNARRRSDKPLWILGGPPCQGFSTAGKRRTMDDDRNRLFQQYKEVIATVEPDGFVFENVTGLLNMDGGRVFDLISSTLAEECDELESWVLSAEELAVPQRRKRVLLIGYEGAPGEIQPPPPLTTMAGSARVFDALPPAITVSEALGDLPPLQAGGDGTQLDYRTPPQTAYQRLMRGEIAAPEYLQAVADSLVLEIVPAD